MKKLGIFGIAILLLSAVGLLAHPHIQKTVTAKLDAAELTLNYYTSPANMEHVKNTEAGVFKGGARLTVSGDLGKVPAGEYTVGALKNEDGSWVMALYPGKLGYGASPDMSKLIKLSSSLSKDHGTAHHTSFDLAPGSGEQEGQLTLVWHFGPLHLAGALS